LSVASLNVHMKSKHPIEARAESEAQKSRAAEVTKAQKPACANSDSPSEPSLANSGAIRSDGRKNPTEDASPAPGGTGCQMRRGCRSRALMCRERRACTFLKGECLRAPKQQQGQNPLEFNRRSVRQQGQSPLELCRPPVRQWVSKQQEQQRQQKELHQVGDVVGVCATCAHTHAHTHTRTRARTHTRTHTHARRHARTHTHTCTCKIH